MSAEPAAAESAAAAPATYIGPFDREAWPERLVARVVSPGPAPRIHGYAVEDDLARYHGIADVAWLALRGELPTPEERAAFSAALVLLAPIHIGEAPAHAALLSRLAGAHSGATVAIAAVGLAELARCERRELAPWLAWLDAGDETQPVPDCAHSRTARAYAALHRLGFTTDLDLDAVSVWARLLTVIAEAAGTAPGAVRSYPARLPDYQYTDDAGASP